MSVSSTPSLVMVIVVSMLWMSCVVSQVDGRPLAQVLGGTVGANGATVNPINITLSSQDTLLGIEVQPCNNGDSFPQLLLSSSSVPSSVATAMWNSNATPYPVLEINNPSSSLTYYVAVRGTHPAAATKFNLYVYTNRFTSNEPLVGGLTNKTAVTLEDTLANSVLVSVVPATPRGSNSNSLRYRTVVARAANNRALSTACGADTTLYSDVVLGQYGQNIHEFSTSSKLIFQIPNLIMNTTYDISVQVYDVNTGNVSAYTPVRTTTQQGQCGTRVTNTPFCSMVTNLTSSTTGNTGFAEDLQAQGIYDRFSKLLAQYDCEDPRGYSKWRCPDCLAAYKTWACAITFPVCPTSSQTRPCRPICENVVRKCPTILGFDRCPSDYVDYGIAGRCESYGEDFSTSAGTRIAPQNVFGMIIGVVIAMGMMMMM